MHVCCSLPLFNLHLFVSIFWHLSFRCRCIACLLTDIVRNKYGATHWANWLSSPSRVIDCPTLCLLPFSLSGKYSNWWYGNLWMSSDLKCKAGSPGDELAPCCTLSTTQADIRIPCAGRNPRIWSRCGNLTRSNGTSGPAPNSSQREGKSKMDWSHCCASEFSRFVFTARQTQATG